MLKLLFVGILVINFSAQAEEAKTQNPEPTNNTVKADAPTQATNTSKKISRKDEWRNKHPRLKLMQHEDAPTEKLRF